MPALRMLPLWRIQLLVSSEELLLVMKAMNMVRMIRQNWVYNKYFGSCLKPNTNKTINMNVPQILGKHSSLIDRKTDKWMYRWMDRDTDREVIIVCRQSNNHRWKIYISGQMPFHWPIISQPL